MSWARMQLLSKLEHKYSSVHIQEIKEIITSVKKQNPHSWWCSDNSQYYVEEAICNAIEAQQNDIVHLFLKEGLPPTVHAGKQHSYKPLLYFATQSKDDYLFLLLLNAVAESLGSNPSEKQQREAYDPGMKAAIENGDLQKAEILLQKGANIDGYMGNRYDGPTYLTHAVLNGHQEMALFLVANNADIKRAIKKLLRIMDEKERYAPAPLDTRRKFQTAIKFLLDYAAGVDLLEEEIKFLENLDNVAGFNFIGISIDGKPIDREYLNKKKLNGADQAMISIADLRPSESVSIERIHAINACLQWAFKKRGRYIEEKREVVNLIPLLKAAEIGDQKAVVVRVEAGDLTDINLALVVAAEQGHMEIVKNLISSDKVDKRAYPHAVRAAQEKNKNEIADYLFSLQPVDQMDFEGMTLLHHAAKTANVAEVKKLLDHKAGINVRRENKSNPATPLSIAASYCYFESDWDGSNEQSEKHLTILHLLLEHKAIVDHSALYHAARSIKAMELLLPHIDKKPEPKGLAWYVSPMFSASKSADAIAILKLLKEAGADFNANVKTPFETTLLLSLSYKILAHTISTVPHVFEQMKFLLSNGADPNLSVDNEHNTFLHVFVARFGDFNCWATVSDFLAILGVSCQHGFHINGKNQAGESLLDIATKKGNKELIECLNRPIKIVDEVKSVEVAIMPDKRLDSISITAGQPPYSVSSIIEINPVSLFAPILKKSASQQPYSVPSTISINPDSLFAPIFSKPVSQQYLSNKPEEQRLSKPGGCCIL
jgi:ankyrin repeat protein